MTKPSGITNLATKLTVTEQRNKELVQAVQVKINGNTSVTSVYVGPQTSGRTTETRVDRIIDGDGERPIIVGELNARNQSWDTLTNGRGTTIRKLFIKRDLKITEPPKPSYVTKGSTGASKPNLLLDNKRAVVSQQTD